MGLSLPPIRRKWLRQAQTRTGWSTVGLCVPAVVIDGRFLKPGNGQSLYIYKRPLVSFNDSYYRSAGRGTVKSRLLLPVVWSCENLASANRQWYG